MSSEVTAIITQLIEIHDGRPWMGSSYARKFAELGPDKVFEVPADHMHSVAQLIAHLSFWRKEGILKIRSGSGSKTDDDPENWPTNEELREIGWETIKNEHDQSLTELLNLLSEKDDQFLDLTYYDNDFKDVYPYRFLIYGLLHHDIYHLGQLGMVVKQLAAAPALNS